MSENNWLVLVFQFPKGSGSHRVRLWRRLQGIGAVAIKNSMYVLPRTEQSQEDFEWTLAELRAVGADAVLIEAQFLSGMSDDDVKALFNAARDKDYDELTAEIESARERSDGGSTRRGSADAAQALGRARRRLAEIEAIDFFTAARHEGAQASLWALEQRVGAAAPLEREGGDSMKRTTIDELEGHTWVTRRNVRVDRIASAWLIRRWIDPEAPLKFVNAKSYVPGNDEIRFDMFEGEFTHEGDQCTFEVLADTVAPDDAALRAVGEIVHDIDLKDGKFARPETEGIASLISGLVNSLDNDDERIERGAALFEDLYKHFRSTAA